VRTDCRTLTIETGVKYAQYNNAIKVTYLESGKRKPRYFILDYMPFLVVVNRADAIQPDGMYGPGVGSGDVVVSTSRHPSHDPGWIKGFMAKLKTANVTPVYQVGTEAANVDATQS
jgi:hypothetical protein